MGSWDVYCALCAGPLGISVRFRRKRVERSTSESQREGESEEGTDEEESGDDDSRSYTDDEEAYDPEVLKMKDAEWLEKCRCLVKVTNEEDENAQ